MPHVVGFSKHGLLSSIINIDNDRDLRVENKIVKKSLIKRLYLKIENVYLKRKFKVVRNNDGVWYNSLDLIQPKF